MTVGSRGLGGDPSREHEAATVPFDRPPDGYGHRPRWTAEEVAAHRALLEAVEHAREWFYIEGVTAMYDVMGEALDAAS